MENINRQISTWIKKPFNTTAIVFALLAYILLPVMNSTMLRWFDEMSLFEPDMLFWKQTTYYPGGFLKYIGAFLIQLFYYPWLGSTLLITLWVAMAYALRSAFRLHETGKSLLAFIIPLCLLCSVSGMDEGWLTMNFQGYFFSQTLGIFISILIFHAYRSISSAWIRTVLLAMTGLAYLPFGYYAILSIGLCTVFEAVSAVGSRNWKHLLPPVAGIAVVVIVPWICYTCIPGVSVDNDKLYIKGLPEFTSDGFETWLKAIFCIQTIALAIFSASAALKKGISVDPMLSYSILVLGGACVISSTISVSKQVKCAIEMLHYIDYSQWNNAIKVINETDVEPDFNMMILNNLSRKRLGLPLVYGIQRPKFDVESTELRREGITTNVFLNVPVNYHLGKSNNAYRWAMEHTVKYGKRVFFLKYMVRASLLNGDFELARKYNRILLNTMFHRKWAEHYQPFIDHPELMMRSKEFTGIPEYNPQTIFLQ